MPPMNAQIVDIFHGPLGKRSAIFAAGRLENGESFGLVDDRIEPVLYIRRSEKDQAQSILQKHQVNWDESPFRSLDGEAVGRVSCPTVQGLRRLDQDLQSQEIRTYEADIDFAIRFKLDRQISSGIQIEGSWRPSEHVDRLFFNPDIKASDSAIDLRVLALDIETDDRASKIFGLSLIAWTLQGEALCEEVHLVGTGSTDEAVFVYPDEKHLLQAFQKRVIALDPDILTGWNVIDFDLSVLGRLCGKYRVPFLLGRTKEKSYVKANKSFGRSRAVVQGRQVIDALQLVRFSLSHFEDLRLDTVAREILGRGKTLAVEEWEDVPAKIAEVYQSDRSAFCAYVLEDSRLVRDILQSQKLLELSLARSVVTRMSLEKAWSSVLAFETLYIGDMRKRSLVAPTWGIDSEERWGNIGGLILNPQVGLHRDVFVFDFKSLYPSIIRTFNIDPLAYAMAKAKPKAKQLIEAPNGARFDRTPGILPAILDDFSRKREEAKRQGNPTASYTYKILMNSFYGVLATDSCRFADSAIADAITSLGQHLLLWMQKHFESQGLAVLYGDTDSLFVKVPLGADWDLEKRLAEGQRLCAAANLALAAYLQAEYALSSYMELEFEKYYRRFFLPSDRQGEGGRAKNYAGLRQQGGVDKLEITGMEAVRSDWTALARNLQRDLLGMLFQDASPEAITTKVRVCVRSLLAGEMDGSLIYRKRIRKPLEAYTKTTPPHIKAARLLPKTVKVIRYVMSTEGPQPIGFLSAPILYQHYIDKQIRPIVEGLAVFAGLDIEAIFRPDDVEDLVLMRR